MSEFRNILVGVDLSRAARLDAAALGPVADGAVSRAIWLARQDRAALTFFAALNEAGQAWHLLDAEHRAPATRAVEGTARQVLTDLARRAKDEGVEARADLVPGAGWH